MGLNPNYHGPVFGRDQWAGSTLALAILMLLMCVVLPGQQTFAQKFMYSILMAIQLGMAIIAGTIVADRFIQTKEGAANQFPPLLELTAASLLVTGLSIMLRIGWPLVPAFLNTGTLDLPGSVNQFLLRWPFVLLPFVCTLSVGTLCTFFASLGWGWMRLAAIGGIINGLVFAATTVLIVQLLDPTFMASAINPSEAMVVGSCAALGVLIGIIVLPTFAKSPQPRRIAIRPSPMSLNSISNNLAGGLSTDNSQQMSGRAIRDVGGYTRNNAAEIEGRYVCFRPGFSNPTAINAYHIRILWDNRLGSLVFQEEERADRLHTQSGQIYIPDGKPFLSLVTLNNGAIRVITVTRPDQQGTARGMIFTLSNPKGAHYTPACSPIVLQRLGEENLTVGILRPGMSDYTRYSDELNRISPDFAYVAMPEKSPLLIDAPSVIPEQATTH